MEKEVSEGKKNPLKKKKKKEMERTIPSIAIS